MPPLKLAATPDHSPWPHLLGDPVGRFHTWWRGDLLPSLPDLPGLSIAPAAGEVVGRLAGIDASEVRDRLRLGHEPWLARIVGVPVGWGWCATTEASIGELGISPVIPPGNRYLWDFWTVPSWRGQGIYPRLLQTIVTREADVARFWVGHDLGNAASACGIAKAGFQEVGLLYRREDSGFVLVPCAPPPRVAAASALFGVPIAGHRQAFAT